MTEEEKAKLEAEQAKSEEEAAKDEESAEEDTEEEESEEEDESKSSDKIDYEAELAKEREAREKAEKAAADNAFKLREERRKRDGEQGHDKDGEDKPLTAKELQAILAQERQETEKALQAQRIAEIAGKLAASESEKNLVIEIHKNRTFPAHLSLEEQIEESFVIANRKKILGENSELKRALRGKAGVNDNAASAHQEAPKAGEPKMPAADLRAIKSVGYTWNGKSNRYEKKINGGLLTYDPRTKKTLVVK